MSSILNNYFDKIYCINLDSRTDRWKKCSEQFEKMDLSVERFSAIDKNNIYNPTQLSDGQYACALSHLGVMQMAKAQNLNNILIFEDDVVLSNNISEVFEKNIKSVPDDWIMLYLGGSHLNGTVHVEHDVYRMNASLTTHAYALKGVVLDALANNIENWFTTWPQPLDVYYSALHRSNPCYLIQDGLAQLSWQDSGFSDIENAVVDYTWLK